MIPTLPSHNSSNERGHFQDTMGTQQGYLNGYLNGVKSEVLGKGTLRYWRWLVAQEKMTRQVSALKLILQKEKIDFYGTFPVQARTDLQREYIRQLEIAVVRCDEAIKVLRELKVKGCVRSPGVWDKLMIRLYSWSVLGK